MFSFRQINLSFHGHFPFSCDTVIQSHTKSKFLAKRGIFMEKKQEREPLAFEVNE